MRDYALHRAMALGETGGWSVSLFLRRWWARRFVRKLEQLEDHLLTDIGITRDDLRWAAELPLSVNAAIALDELAKRKRLLARGD